MSDKKNVASNTYEHYVKDSLLLLKSDAKEAKRQFDQMDNSNDSSYWSGYLSAYHNVISLLKAQADAFGIPAVELALHDIDPEADLLASGHNIDEQ